MDAWRHQKKRRDRPTMRTLPTSRPHRSRQVTFIQLHIGTQEDLVNIRKKNCATAAHLAQLAGDVMLHPPPQPPGSHAMPSADRRTFLHASPALAAPAGFAGAARGADPAPNSPPRKFRL